MAEEIDILLDMNFAVTCNTKRPAQYMSSRTIVISGTLGLNSYVYNKV